MSYGWANWHQQVSYGWKGWFAYKPRWTNPRSDAIGPRHICTDTVTSSKPIEWPVEYRDVALWAGPVGQTSIWQGTLLGAGQPVQRVDRMHLREFVIDNRYGGDLWRDGKFIEHLSAGQQWEAYIPEPVRLRQDGWAVEGYPNALNKGDRHWYGVEDDGTCHEAIWTVALEHIAGTVFSGLKGDTMADYCCYAPDGSLLTGIMKGSHVGVVKGNVQWTSLAWNRGDPPHRLGAVFHDLALVAMNAAASDGTRADWTFPAYGQLFRLSSEVYNRLSANADDEQQSFLDSLHNHGVMPYDTGGNDWGASISIVAGAQHVGSTIGDLSIQITDLELVNE